MTMPGDKEIKLEFRKKASLEPDKYYATSVLKEEGFLRKKCGNCGRYYWTVHTDSRVCGDPACSGGFRFINGSPARKKLDYIEVWKEFASQFQKLGYTPIRRYPVAARWRDDTDFVQASIYDFQPYVVSGEVEPPANPLVVPQFCLRFNDIDNVGITGAHYTGFVMIGQHAFMPPEKWKQSDYFRDIHSWLSDGLGLPNEEITYHEDAWAGGGNMGPCMEFFSRGLELGNQVYMTYETTPHGYKELKLKVLDMGMGQERNAWFTGAAPTSYETTFPTVVKKLQEITGVSVEPGLLQKFLPYSSYLNVDEVENIDKAWENVAGKVGGISAAELKKTILPLSALYSVAEHSRSLLVALSDGVLPSNVAGGYNLRVILRRALSFIDSYGWQVDMAKLFELHATYLKPQFPELSENLSEVADILGVEKRKFAETKKRSAQIVEQILKKNEEIGSEKLVQLYDSNGISPDLIKEEARKLGKAVAVPDNFYAMVAERHEKSKQQQTTATTKEIKLDLEGVPATKVLYYGDYTVVKFSATILKIIDDKYVVLDQTYFYPTSGGQEHDAGEMAGCDVTDVFKQGNVVVHVLRDNNRGLKAGQKVDCQINWERRQQLAQHHTATHVLNGVCRKMLGNHVWQAGAAKFVDKARIDITHYEQLSEQQLQQIEEEANKIIAADVPVHKSFVPRTEAEQKYGFSIYQGGVVPGKLLRIVDVEGLDVEACGGTHLNHTGEVGRIKILRSSKIQDVIVRLEYVAGKAESSAAAEKEKIVAEAAKLLNCEPNQLPGRVEELFENWKDAVKKGKAVDAQLTSATKYEGDILAKVVEILRTQPENVTKTITRFLSELKTVAEKPKH
ncbi:alanine--tRNA ligase [Candidatus Woesearchaeota archaeon]|nr:alanine--tRNA ligase [Candidatus Woesearchaeota archaeon]